MSKQNSVPSADMQLDYSYIFLLMSVNTSFSRCEAEMFSCSLQLS